MNSNLIELIALLMIELDTNEILLDLDELSSLEGMQVKINHDWENGTVNIAIEPEEPSPVAEDNILYEDEVITIDEELAQALTVDEDEEVTEEQPN